MKRLIKINFKNISESYIKKNNINNKLIEIIEIDNLKKQDEENNTEKLIGLLSLPWITPANYNFVL